MSTHRLQLGHHPAQIVCCGDFLQVGVAEISSPEG